MKDSHNNNYNNNNNTLSVTHALKTTHEIYNFILIIILIKFVINAFQVHN